MLGVQRHGVFAEAARLPASQVRLLPAALSWRVGAYAEPVAAALAVMKVPMEPASRVLVLGGGRIADLTRRVLAVHGIAAQSRPERDAFDVVIETAAEPAVFAQMLASVRPGGTVVLKSRAPDPVALDVALAVRKEITLAAVHYGDFDTALALLADGRVIVDDLLGDSYPLTSFAAAFEAAGQSESRKVFFELAVPG
jgi:threonine dehydrogenase-like Zn-dependent dehydrogenase